MKNSSFDIRFKKISDENHESEIYFIVDEQNICLFKHIEEKRYKTTRWNLDELVLYLRDLPIMLKNDSPFPFDVERECAAELDNNARFFDSDNDEELEKYYICLNDWGYNHSWHHASSGAILADVFFRRVDDDVEISWWSDQEEDEIVFKNKYGFILFPYDDFVDVINKSVYSYNELWL